MANQSMIEAALRYASLGIYIFPVGSNKKPLVAKGFKSATIDREQIVDWWEQWPDAGIAMPTGRKNGIIVLDVDMYKPGVSEIFEELLKAYPDLNSSMQVRSPRGGIHHYFKYPENHEGIIRSTQEFLGKPGVDTRADRGYIVLPPSGHESGKIYEWVSYFDKELLPKCPQVIIDYKGKAKRIIINDEGPASENILTEGNRHSSLVAAAGVMRSVGLPADSIYEALTIMNNQRCRPPMTDTEIRTIANSMNNYPPSVTNRTVTQGARQELLRFRHTDAGAAEMFGFTFTDKLVYNHSSGNWLIWDNHHWRKDDTEQVVNHAIESARELSRASTILTESEAQQEVQKYARVLESRDKINAILSIAKSLPTIATTHRQWDQSPTLFGTANGVIDLTTGEFREGTPQDKISMFSEINYDPKAKAPRWEQFIKEIFPNNQEVQDFVQRAVGYTLTGFTTEQCLFLLIGNGANGKTVFLDTLRPIFGLYYYNTPFTTFERMNGQAQQTNDIAAMAGKRIVVSSETNEGATFNEARVKSLTGGETVTARYLHQEYFQYQPVLKIWLAVNHAPRVRDDSDGFWRRVRRIDFKEKFDAERADKSLGEKLKLEASGILNWAIEGCRKWQQIGLNPPQIIINSTNQYREDSDPLSDFMLEAADINPNNKVLCDAFYRAYSAWCKMRDLKTFERLGSERFVSRVAREYPKEIVDGRRYFMGITLSARGDEILNDQDGGFVVTVKKSGTGA